MTQSEAHILLEKIVQKPVFAQALSQLKDKTEIAIRYENNEDFALFMHSGEVTIESRAAAGADVCYSVSAEGLRQLSDNDGDSLTKFGIAVLEQIVAGRVKVEICGSIWGVLTNGYVKIILAAGPEFLAFLAPYGLASIQKITAMLGKLKK